MAFEFPLVVYVLTFMGILRPGLLARGWRVAQVSIAVLAPMIVLYFFSTGLRLLAGPGRRGKRTKDSPSRAG